MDPKDFARLPADCKPAVVALIERLKRAEAELRQLRDQEERRRAKNAVRARLYRRKRKRR